MGTKRGEGFYDCLLGQGQGRGIKYKYATCKASRGGGRRRRWSRGDDDKVK